MISYTRRMFDLAVENIMQLYYRGKSVDEISREVNLSEIIVKGVIERYRNVGYKN